MSNEVRMRWAVRLTSGSTGMKGYGSNIGSTKPTKAESTIFAHSRPPSASSTGLSVTVIKGQTSRYAYEAKRAIVTIVKWPETIRAVGAGANIFQQESKLP